MVKVDVPQSLAWPAALVAWRVGEALLRGSVTIDATRKDDVRNP